MVVVFATVVAVVAAAGNDQWGSRLVEAWASQEGR